MQCFEPHETLGITVCAVPIYIGKTKNWSLVMKFTYTIGHI
jgi:hypothetical protein